MKRIDKRIARKLFYEGKTIYLLPSNVREDNMWVMPCPITYVSAEYSFNCLIEMYEYYNCVGQMGRYAKYYIKEEIC